MNTVTEYYSEKLQSLKTQLKQLLEASSAIEVEAKLEEIEAKKKASFLKDADTFFELCLREDELYLQLKEKNNLLRKAKKIEEEIQRLEKSLSKV